MTKVRWAIAGTGRIAAEFAAGLSFVPDAELLAVGSRAQERASAFATAFHVPRSYSSYEALAQDPDIDVVYVATPNTCHKDNCLLFIDCGKAVLCEKPFAPCAADARVVVLRARTKRVFCMEGMWMRCIPLIRDLSKLLESGVIGELRMVTMQLGFSNTVDPGHRLFDPALGGGALLDLGVYPLSLAFHLLGVPATVESQSVIGSTGVDEQVAILLGYSQGQQAVITVSIRNQTPNDAMIMGTEGFIHIHAPLFYPRGLTLTGTPPNTSMPKPHPTLRKMYSSVKRYLPLPHPRRTKSMTWRYRGNGYNYEAAEVVRCLQAGELESPIVPLDETVRILDVMDVVRQKSAVGSGQEA